MNKGTPTISNESKGTWNMKCSDWNNNVHSTYGLAATAVLGIPARVIEDIACPRYT
jgi:hypothetical protein